VKFIDEATIIVQSGDGGRGCVSFRRERAIPKGGPDGGDGGKGGDVVLEATLRKRTLFHLHFKKHYKAPSGAPGQGQQKSGHGGQDLIIAVPLGTLVSDVQTGARLFDLVADGQQAIVARGGRGGLGNVHFKSATNRAPRHSQPGEGGQTLTLKLELKLIADIGIIGLPNAGKSSLINAISSTRAKIGSYPFTTLTPNLGVVHIQGLEPFVVADIPGLIAGAHQGAGLGVRFLRHVERTRALVHLIDAAALTPDDPLQALRTVNHELAMYSAALAQKPQLVVLNKLDLDNAATMADRFCEALGERAVLRISAATHQGLDVLKSCMAKQLECLNEEQ
jgi:GTP-binding protein